MWRRAESYASRLRFRSRVFRKASWFVKRSPAKKPPTLPVAEVRPRPEITDIEIEFVGAAPRFDLRDRSDDPPVSFDTFTQLDFRLAQKHHLTTTFSFFPVEVENLGLSALVTSDASPDFESGGWNAAFSGRSFFSRTLVETIVAVKRYNVRIEPKGEGPSRLTPEGLRDNYFNSIDRESLRFEVGSACTHAS